MLFSSLFIQSATKSKPATWHTRVFPRLAPAACFCFEFWLAHYVIWICSDWPDICIIGQAWGQDGGILANSSRPINTKKIRTRPLFRHLDRTSLVNKGFIRSFNYLFILFKTFYLFLSLDFIDRKRQKISGLTRKIFFFVQITNENSFEPALVKCVLAGTQRAIPCG